jgi:hypothetical protein
MATAAAQADAGTQTIQLKAIPLTPQSFQPFGQVWPPCSARTCGG